MITIDWLVKCKRGTSGQAAGTPLSIQRGSSQHRATRRARCSEREECNREFNFQSTIVVANSLAHIKRCRWSWTGVSGRHNLIRTRHHRCLLKLAVCWREFGEARFKQNRQRQARPAGQGQCYQRNRALKATTRRAGATRDPRCRHAGRCRVVPARSIPRASTGASPGPPWGAQGAFAAAF